MHIPDIKEIRNDLGENFEKVLRENWNVIFQEDKFHTSYFDGNKEVTLRFRVKEKTNNKVVLETEKDVKHIA
jgi:hypothetical protein